jgi:hypothetical protein
MDQEVVAAAVAEMEAEVLELQEAVAAVVVMEAVALVRPMMETTQLVVAAAVV